MFKILDQKDQERIGVALTRINKNAYTIATVDNRNLLCMKYYEEDPFINCVLCDLAIPHAIKNADFVRTECKYERCARIYCVGTHRTDSLQHSSFDIKLNEFYSNKSYVSYYRLLIYIVTKVSLEKIVKYKYIMQDIGALFYSRLFSLKRMILPEWEFYIIIFGYYVSTKANMILVVTQLIQTIQEGNPQSAFNLMKLKYLESYNISFNKTQDKLIKKHLNNAVNVDEKQDMKSYVVNPFSANQFPLVITEEYYSEEEVYKNLEMMAYLYNNFNQYQTSLNYGRIVLQELVYCQNLPDLINRLNNNKI
jgi:hypothetical protein